MLFRRALTDLLRKKPIQSISVRELCETAGINRGTFYAHYTDIYELRQQIEDDMQKDFMEAFRPGLSCSEKEPTLLAITTQIFQCLKENADVCAMTMGPYGDKEFAARLINLGWESCAESYQRYFSDATPKQLDYYYTFVCKGCIGLLEKWLAEGMASSAEEIAALAAGIMRCGVGFLRGEAEGPAEN